MEGFNDRSNDAMSTEAVVGIAGVIIAVIDLIGGIALAAFTYRKFEQISSETHKETKGVRIENKITKEEVHPDGRKTKTTKEQTIDADVENASEHLTKYVVTAQGSGEKHRDFRELKNSASIYSDEEKNYTTNSSKPHGHRALTAPATLLSDDGGRPSVEKNSATNSSKPHGHRALTAPATLSEDGLPKIRGDKLPSKSKNNKKNKQTNTTDNDSDSDFLEIGPILENSPHKQYKFRLNSKPADDHIVDMDGLGDSAPNVGIDISAVLLLGNGDHE